MTGPEHYQEGERLLALAESQGTNATLLTVLKAQAHFAAAQAAEIAQLNARTSGGGRG